VLNSNPQSFGVARVDVVAMPKPTPRKTVYACSSFVTIGKSAFVFAAAMGLFCIPAAALEAKDCVHEETNSIAIRACTALLGSPQLDDDARRRFLLRRGNAWAKEDEAGEAVADYTSVLQINPSDVAALTGRARVLTVLGKHADAIKDWTAIIASASNPEEWEPATFERGNSALAAGDARLALEDFAKVTEFNSKKAKGHLGRAKAFAILNDRDGERIEIDLAEAADASDPAPFYTRAEAAERDGDVAKAIDNYMAGLRLNSRAGWPARKALKRLGVDSPP
jgi:tetratricopeptide (TPR) repeat protein